MRNRRLRAVTKASVLQTQKWYREHNWKARIAAYDLHLDAIVLEEREEALRLSARDVAEEHMAILASGREIVALEFARIATLTRDSRGVNSVLKTSELIKLTEQVIKLDRLVRDQTTEISGQVTDLSKLTDEELAIYETLLAKSKATSGEVELDPDVQH
jgi:hypothetical protein